ncbi:alpha carbonic anhydrase 1, chloroplastic-like [Aristolochia californica]|uniref:alpha carbonic anhydrase 1, chloroplastic-like n=1 Tax=Aristolochia californica TaxID=171875 RepID=UPI0035DD90D4
MAMRDGRVVLVGIVSFLLVGAANAHIISDDVSFTYSGMTGPANWGDLSPDFAVCSGGKQQSPIDIRKEDASSKNQSLDKDYQDANATLVNNGFNIGVKMESYAGALNLNGKNYTLQQLHWHSPAEHTINGVRHPAELHLLHRSDDGEISVVAILYKLGDADPFLNQMMDQLADLDKEVCKGDEEAHIPLGILKNKQLQKETRKYYRYMGSLTTPPCQEDVTWSILGKVREMSLAQLNALRAPLDSGYTKNARPLQDLNDRKVELHQC